MSDIAVKFLIANLAASAAILLVLALRKPARAMFGARLAYTLWLLAPLAALASLLPPRVVDIVLPAFEQPAPLAFEPATSAIPVQPPAIETMAAVQRTEAPLDAWTIAWLAWVAGAIATLAWQLRNQSRFMADARAGFAGPAVAGFLRPRIVTPSDFEDRFDKDERNVILAHETIHLDRNDARINALVALLRCLAWFNPLVHLAAHLMRIDQELACDAAVVERHPRAKAVYAAALLKAQLASRPLPLGCYWPAGNEHPLTERIEMLKQTSPGHGRRVIGVGALAFLAIGAGVSAWAALPPQTRLIEAPQDQPAPAPQAPVDLSALPGFNARDRIEITGEVVRTDGDDPAADFWVQATSIRRNGGPAEPNAQLWRIDLSALRAGQDRIMAGHELGYAPPKNRQPESGPKHVRVSAYGPSDTTCDPDCRAQAVMIMFAPKPDGSANHADNAPQSQIAPVSGTAPSPFDNVHLVVLQGTITRIDLGAPASYVWLETSSVARPDATAKQTRQTWRVKASAEPNAPNWARDPKTIGMAVEVRGYSGEETVCDPDCTMNGTAIRQLSGYPMPGITFGSGFWLPPGPPLPEPPKTGAQPIRFEPQQAPAARQDTSRELPPPPMQPVARSVPENWAVTGAPPTFDTGSQVYLRGKVEKIEFSNTKYVVFLRASSVARDHRDTDGVPRPSAAYPNTDVWELSPTNYFGDRDFIRADLMGETVEVSGLNLAKDCKPSCRIKVNDLIMPRSSQVPQPRADESLINQFGYWYDTNAPQTVRGKVERIEFSDKTFDAYIRSESRGALPSRLYQVRSEYRFERADIERALLDKTVVASGWRARNAINTYCDPVCGLYANNLQFPNASRLTPAGARLVEPSPLGLRPRGDYYLALADFGAPITLKGKITRYVPNVLGADNPQLWIEASGVSPETTFGSKAGTVWVVAGFPFEPHDNYDPMDSTRELRAQAAQATARVADLAKRYSPKHPEMVNANQEKATLEARIADELWVGKNVTIRGFNVEDKRCQPQCLMAGNSIEMR